MSMKLLEKLLTEKLTYLNPPDRSDKKTFYNIRKYLKELSRYKLRKDIKEQELDELIRFVKNVDTYVQKSEDGARAIRFIQNDLINVDLFIVKHKTEIILKLNNLKTYALQEKLVNNKSIFMEGINNLSEFLQKM